MPDARVDTLVDAAAPGTAAFVSKSTMTDVGNARHLSVRPTWAGSCPTAMGCITRIMA
jgi:hypothetical protein